MSSWDSTSKPTAGHRHAIPADGPGPLVDDDTQPSGGGQPTARGLRRTGDLRAAAMVSSAASASAAPVAFQGDSPAAGACQHGVDAKAFTGKGEGRPLRLARLHVDSVHREMVQVAADSVQIGGGMLYLTVHRRTLPSGLQLMLRWRGYSVMPAESNLRSRHVHLSWAEARERIDVQPYRAQQALKVLDLRAKDLNRREQEARGCVRLLARGKEVNGRIVVGRNSRSGRSA